MESADACWQRAPREVWRRGWGRGGRTLVVLGEGADGIWRQARCQLSGAGGEVVEIVDFYHAAQHLGIVAAAVFGAGSAPAATWLDQHRHLLRHQGSGPVRRALAKLRPRTAVAVDVVRTARSYVRTHAARMRYPLFRSRQFPIGSGASERTAKNLIQQRQTQAGMRWSLPGAQAVARLRALHRSGRWTAFWQRQPHRRLHLLRTPQTPTEAQTTVTVPPPAAVPTTPVPSPVPAPVVLDPQTPPADAPPAPSRKPWEKGKDYWRRQSLFYRRSA